MKSRSLLSYALTGNWGGLTACWILGVSIMALSLVMPHAVGRLTNLFSQAGGMEWGPVNRALLALVGAQLGLAILTFFRRRTEARLHESGSRSLMIDVLGRVIRFPADFFRDHATEKVVARVIEDSQKVAKFYLDAMVSVPLAVLSVVIFGVIMVLGNAFLGLCMIPLSLLTGYFILFDRRIRKANMEANEAGVRLRAEAAEIVTGVAELRNHAAFDHALTGLEETLEKRRAVSMEIGKLNSIFMAMNPLVYTIQTGVLYWLGAALCIAGSWLYSVAGPLTWGDVIGFMLLATLFQRPVADIADFGLRWRLSRESIEGLQAYLGRECAFTSSPDAPYLPSAPLDIGLEQVSVSTPSGARIVDGVTLQIPAGQHLALAGPAGCGKSTLIQLLTRGTEASAGHILVGGRDCKEVNFLSLAREIGFVPQKPVLFNTSLRNNLLLSLRRPSERTLRDEGGTVDVSRHDDVQDARDLDRELVRAVQEVGLDRDVLRKCLENQAPTGDRAIPLRQSIVEIRAEVRRKLSDPAPSPVAPFDPEMILPGTLAENLFGPERDPTSSAVIWLKRITTTLAGREILLDLVRIGCHRYFSERALAVRTLQRAPQLMEFLPVGRAAGDLDANARLESSREALAVLPPKLRNILLEIALDGPVEPESTGLADLERGLLQARRLLWEAGGGRPRAWTPVDSNGWVEGLTVGENILWGRVGGRILGAPERVDEVIRRTLEERGLLQAVLVMGLEYRVGEDGKYLSGGQRQKVAIARVLLKRPGLLLMDEATASLDELSQSRIVDLIDSQFAGRTVVSISHRLSTIRHYDRIAVLDRGQVVQQGTYDELSSQDGIFKNLLHQQGAKANQRTTLRPHDSKGMAGEAVDGALLRHSLALSPVFASMSGDQLVFLERVARVARCPRGHTLFKRGDPGNEIFLILEGEVEFLLEAGEVGAQRTEIISTYGPGRVFGELALFGDGVRTAGARAKTDLLLCVITREDLMRLISADPQIAVGLLKGIARRMAEITDEAAGRKP